MEEHHSWHNTQVMLPLVTKLVPPVPLDHLGLLDLINCPQMLLLFVQEDGLIHGLISPRLLLVCGLELMLVVAAIE